MAKDISATIKFDSNGKAVMGLLTVPVKELQSAMQSVQEQNKSSFSNLIASAGGAVNTMRGAIEGISNLAQPYMAFDQAMLAAIMETKNGANDFGLLKAQSLAVNFCGLL